MLDSWHDLCGGSQPLLFVEDGYIVAFGETTGHSRGCVVEVVEEDVGKLLADEVFMG